MADPTPLHALATAAAAARHGLTRPRSTRSPPPPPTRRAMADPTPLHALAAAAAEARHG
jgi:hypothetical protein